MIKNYNNEIDKITKISDTITIKNISNYVVNDEDKISWAASLKMSAVKKEKIEYTSKNIVIAMYRPFTKKYLYRDRIINERVRKSYQTFPDTNSENLLINVSGAGYKGEFSTLITSNITFMDMISKSRNFPRYIYEDNSIFDGKIDNISSDNEFYYIYSLLHSPGYRKKYSNDLQKGLPRIPNVKNQEKYVEIGFLLADLHLNYEHQPSWNGVEVVINTSNPSYRVTKMKHPKKGMLNTIVYNEHITIKNIPEKAYEYVVNGRPAIEWIIDQYRIKTDKKSGIVDDPNEFSNDPKYILNLLLSIITVSMKTLELIDELPEFKVIEF